MPTSLRNPESPQAIERVVRLLQPGFQLGTGTSTRAAGSNSLKAGLGIWDGRAFELTEAIEGPSGDVKPHMLGHVFAPVVLLPRFAIATVTLPRIIDLRDIGEGAHDKHNSIGVEVAGSLVSIEDLLVQATATAIYSHVYGLPADPQTERAFADWDTYATQRLADEDATGTEWLQQELARMAQAV